ncbi:hypothetical protein GGE65_007831 [Skermanella aerolata]|uniref:hypothetical protein n=1 Tax=Skermanella aerolata TaxID=393310 RepID=UPI003D1E6102
MPVSPLKRAGAAIVLGGAILLPVLIGLGWQVNSERPAPDPCWLFGTMRNPEIEFRSSKG